MCCYVRLQLKSGCSCSFLLYFILDDNDDDDDAYGQDGIEEGYTKTPRHEEVFYLNDQRLAGDIAAFFLLRR